MKSFLSITLIFSLFVGSGLAIGCNNPRYFSVGNQCQEITCTNVKNCSPFSSHCGPVRGDIICRPEKICGCSKQSIGKMNTKPNNCNKQKNGISNCKANQVCTGAGFCIDNPICSTRAEACGNRKCCPDLYCHSRLNTPKTTQCYSAAFPGEKCAVGQGIPCVAGSQCLDTKKVCSKRLNEDCTDNPNICLPGTYCRSRGVPKKGEKARSECY